MAVLILLLERRELWSKLSNLALSVNGPWLAAGDFNAFLHAEDKISATGNKPPGCKHFRDWMRDCDMVEMGFSGSRFTWGLEVYVAKDLTGQWVIGIGF